jgi:hypothetical protein
MAAGAGKTWLACAFVYRLVKFACAARPLPRRPDGARVPGLRPARRQPALPQGISFGADLELITYLLFLKVNEGREQLLGEPSSSPDPARLGRLVSLTDGQEWLVLGADVKGRIYEDLLRRNAGEVRSGAGQYFTPRPLVQAMDPRVGMTVRDPACGTGGFLLAAFDHMRGTTAGKRQDRQLETATFAGVDVAPDLVRLAAMNMYLHGIGEEESPVVEGDALLADPGRRWGVVLTNPPFGRQGAFDSPTRRAGPRASARARSATPSSPRPRTASSTSSSTS